MIAGRKLLLADDSVAIQKVIDLTFSDEGVEVTTVGDGRLALEELERSRPDVVLADVFMPGIGGYELCQFIKQDERFAGIPVMLLVGSFEPFDEAEARRVGADDVVTKPFQSIRQLVSRVGSLLGRQSGDESEAGHQYSTLGLGQTIAATPAETNNDTMTETIETKETNVTVLVEAATMTGPSSHEIAGPACAADAELQTADTMQLEPIEVEPISPAFEPVIDLQADTIETEPVVSLAESESSLSEVGTHAGVSTLNAAEMDDKPEQTAPAASTAAFNETLLDLYEYDDSTRRALADDVILDLDFEEPVSQPTPTKTPEPAVAIHGVAPAEVIPTETTPEEQPTVLARLQEWTLDSPIPVEEVPPAKVTEETQASSSAPEADLGLSPAAIDAIAQRVVEQLSEKVVREIAWEVVPELAELLIKKKLEEQK